MNGKDGKERRAKAWHAYIKAITPVEDEFKKKVGKLFAEQRDEVLSKIDDVTFNADEQISVWMFGRKTWEKRFRDVGRELIKAAVFVNGLRVMEELPAVGVAFNVNNPRAEKWIKDKVFNFAYEVNNTTEKELRRALTGAIKEGASIPDIKKEVKRIFGYAEGFRNERIARTETISASNYGAYEAMKQSGLKVKKEWIPTLDERTRDTHAALADEYPIDIEEPFSNGLKYPGDPAGPAEEVINCRCTIGYVFPEDEE